MPGTTLGRARNTTRMTEILEAEALSSDTENKKKSDANLVNHVNETYERAKPKKRLPTSKLTLSLPVHQVRAVLHRMRVIRATRLKFRIKK
jgi:hypothetical protein